MHPCHSTYYYELSSLLLALSLSLCLINWSEIQLDPVIPHGCWCVHSIHCIACTHAHADWGTFHFVNWPLLFWILMINYRIWKRSWLMSEQFGFFIARTDLQWCRHSWFNNNNLKIALMLYTLLFMFGTITNTFLTILDWFQHHLLLGFLFFSTLNFMQDWMKECDPLHSCVHGNTLLNLWPTPSIDSM
jgi:hypothetical protein